MIRLAIVTTTRAEYGLLRPLIRRVSNDKDIELLLYVSGTHLSERFGNTFKEIENDGFKIFRKVPILSEKTGTEGVAETIANAVINFTKVFTEDKVEYLLVDGDRYEMAAICMAAVNCLIPIIHLGGGDTTEGAADECYRHMITKMSWLHFVTAEPYRERVIRMGESPDRVVTVGSLSTESIKNIDLLSKDILGERIGFNLNSPYALVTFHPVTLETNTAEQQIKELLLACDRCNNIKFIFTKSNADNGGEQINFIIEDYVNKHKDTCLCVSSLGAQKYLSALKYCNFVMGNSSSGIYEAPSFGVPTINIGDRQKGRIQADSIFNCEPNSDEIYRLMQFVMSDDVRKKSIETINPYGDGCVSEKIVKVFKSKIVSEENKLKKKFYDT